MSCDFQAQALSTIQEAYITTTLPQATIQGEALVSVFLKILKLLQCTATLCSAVLFPTPYSPTPELSIVKLFSHVEILKE